MSSKPSKDAAEKDPVKELQDALDELGRQLKRHFYDPLERWLTPTRLAVSLVACFLIVTAIAIIYREPSIMLLLPLAWLVPKLLR